MLGAVCVGGPPQSGVPRVIVNVLTPFQEIVLLEKVTTTLK